MICKNIDHGNASILFNDVEKIDENLNPRNQFLFHFVFGKKGFCDKFLMEDFSVLKSKFK